MAQEVIAFGAPRTEEMTKTAVGVVGAGMTGVVEGVIVKMAPQLGALEVPFTWAALLGIPAIGVAGALFSRGMISDLCQGVAAGGTAIAGFSLPAMLMPDMFGRRAPAGGGQGQLGAGQGVKQLAAGPLGAPQRAQQSVARVGLEF
ncbi:unnamed protein product [marine sediment metagenome]|uniref:Uncharacterized protein n=1 Tax=marine sediment metagenome TaxID=412755 RepID=X1QQ88_9ZZZZ